MKGAAVLLLLLAGCMTAEQERGYRETKQEIAELREHAKHCDQQFRARVEAVDAKLEATRPGIPPVLIDLAVGALWSAAGIGATWLMGKLGLKTVRIGVQAVQRRRRRRDGNYPNSH